MEDTTTRYFTSKRVRAVSRMLLLMINRSCLNHQQNSNHAQQFSKQIPSSSRNTSSDTIKWDDKVTATVSIRSRKGKTYYPFRAILDGASEASYISEYATQFLGLNKMNILASTTGLGGVRTVETKSFVELES